MSASLVGSEMCIRDRAVGGQRTGGAAASGEWKALEKHQLFSKRRAGGGGAGGRQGLWVDRGPA
eukprot:4490260-Alexandrium_andersonii.AAC.1